MAIYFAPYYIFLDIIHENYYFFLDGMIIDLLYLKRYNCINEQVFTASEKTVIRSQSE